jgi:hypothetical protein
MAFESLLSVFNALNKQSVSYLVIGGTAVSYYGQYRPSVNAAGNIVDKPDLDIWYNPTYTNYYNLLNALAELGQNVTRYHNEIAPDPKNSFFRYELTDYTLDLLPRLQASLSFGACFIRRTTVTVAEVDIHFIGLDDLLVDKQALGRAKDLLDIDNLRRNALPPESR